MRTGAVKRKTKETDVEVAINLDGQGRSEISTGIGFLDHMLDLLARHSRIDITVKAKGDLHIDQHHVREGMSFLLKRCGINVGRYLLATSAAIP